MKFIVPLPVQVSSVAGLINKSTKPAQADNGIIRTNIIDVANFFNALFIIFIALRYCFKVIYNIYFGVDNMN